MTTPSPPLDHRFPNWGNALEEGIPLLCSILFGFAGAYFATVSAVSSHEFGRRSFGNLLTFGFIAGNRLDFDVRGAVMILSGIACTCFYVSAIAAIYARMVNTEAINLPSHRTDDQVLADDTVVRRRVRQRSRYLTTSLMAFNIGVFVLPFSAFVFLPDGMFRIVILGYIAVAVLFFFSDRFDR